MKLVDRLSRYCQNSPLSTRGATSLINSQYEGLPEQADLFSSLLELSKEGLCAIIPPKKVIYANSAFSSLFGGKIENSSELDFFALFPADQQQIVRNILNRALGGTRGEERVRCFTVDRTPFAASLRYCLLVSGNRRVVGISISPVGQISETDTDPLAGTTLAPREVEICQLVANGLSSKEVAERLFISNSTVIKHRKNIRKKLGIAGKNVNLVTYLRRSFSTSLLS